MNPKYPFKHIVEVKGTTLKKEFQSLVPEDAIDLVSKLLNYEPKVRLTAIEALAHPFFDELREMKSMKLTDGTRLPDIFNLT